jgi:hypothetical protein
MQGKNIAQKYIDIVQISNKIIINTTNTSGLSSITTLTMPSSFTDREIVIWDGTSGNSIAGRH